MKRSRFSDELTIGILKENRAGLPAMELCRKYGISDATFHTWRKKFGAWTCRRPGDWRCWRRRTRV